MAVGGPHSGAKIPKISGSVLLVLNAVIPVSRAWNAVLLPPIYKTSSYFYNINISHFDAE